MTYLLNPSIFDVIGGSVFVKSIEKVEVSLDSSTNSASVNLTGGQGWSKCVPFQTYRVTSPTGSYTRRVENMATSIEVYNNGGVAAVRVQRGTLISTIPELTVVVYVVEFGSEISVQKVSQSGSGTSWSAAISAVNTSRAFIIGTVRTNSVSNSDNIRDHHVRYVFNSTTQVGCARATGAAFSMTGFIYVVEDISAGNSHFSVNHVTQLDDTSIPQDKTITAVTMNKTMIIGSCLSEGPDYQFGFYHGSVRLLNTTTLRFQRYYNPMYNDWAVQVITFNNSTTIQQGIKTMVYGGTPNVPVTINQGISAIDLSRSIVYPTHNQSQGHTGYGSSGSNNQDFASRISMELTSTTNIGFKRLEYSSNPGDVYVPWQVVQFQLF